MSEPLCGEALASTAQARDDCAVVTMGAEMVPQAAALHITALADSRTAIMGQRYCRAYVDWFRQADDGVALAAIDVHGDVVGYAIGAPLGYPRALSRHLARHAARAFILRPWLIFKPQFRQGALDRWRLFLTGRTVPGARQPEIPCPTMSLVAIGVSPAARRKKIGLRLVRAFETKAAERQMRSLRLSTRADNTAAGRLYERCGWQRFPLSGEMTYYFRILSDKRTSVSTCVSPGFDLE